MQISNLIRSALCDALVDAIDTGGAGTINVRTGAAPAATTDADSGTLLATGTFGGTAFGAASNGVANANAITGGTIAATGTAQHYRVKNGSGTVIFQGGVGTSGQDMTVGTVSFVSGAVFSISAFTVTVPAS